MTDDEQREAVARALYESWRTPGDSAAWDGLYADELRAPWLSSADAALSALAPVQPDGAVKFDAKPEWLAVLVDTAQDALDNDGGYLAADERGQIEAAVASTRAVPVRPDDQARNILRTAARLAGWDMEEYDRVAALAYGGPVQPDPLRAGVEALADEWADAFVTGRAAAVPLWERIEQLRALLAETEVPRG